MSSDMHSGQIADGGNIFLPHARHSEPSRLGLPDPGAGPTTGPAVSCNSLFALTGVPLFGMCALVGHDRPASPRELPRAQQTGMQCG
jgi:hypothetical protein